MVKRVKKEKAISELEEEVRELEGSGDLMNPESISEEDQEDLNQIDGLEHSPIELKRSDAAESEHQTSEQRLLYTALKELFLDIDPTNKVLAVQIATGLTPAILADPDMPHIVGSYTDNLKINIEAISLVIRSTNGDSASIAVAVTVLKYILKETVAGVVVTQDTLLIMMGVRLDNIGEDTCVIDENPAEATDDSNLTLSYFSKQPLVLGDPMYMDPSLENNIIDKRTCRPKNENLTTPEDFGDTDGMYRRRKTLKLTYRGPPNFYDDLNYIGLAGYEKGGPLQICEWEGRLAEADKFAKFKCEYDDATRRTNLSITVLGWKYLVINSSLGKQEKDDIIRVIMSSLHKDSDIMNLSTIQAVIKHSEHLGKSGLKTLQMYQLLYTEFASFDSILVSINGQALANLQRINGTSELVTIINHLSQVVLSTDLKTVEVHGCNLNESELKVLRCTISDYIAATREITDKHPTQMIRAAAIAQLTWKYGKEKFKSIAPNMKAAPINAKTEKTFFADRISDPVVMSKVEKKHGKSVRVRSTNEDVYEMK